MSRNGVSSMRSLGIYKKAVVWLQAGGRGRVGVKAPWWDMWREIPQWSECAPRGQRELNRGGEELGVELCHRPVLPDETACGQMVGRLVCCCSQWVETAAQERSVQRAPCMGPSWRRRCW